jgi:hypothetical protein
MLKKARFDRLRNDLFWTFYDFDDGGKKYSWTGYDDWDWWDDVSKSDTFQIRGKYRLNPNTDEITLVEEK